MKKKLIVRLLVCLLVSGRPGLAQQINYTSGFQTNINHTTCNVFNIAPLSVVNGYTHYPLSGGAYRASSSALVIRAITGPGTAAGSNPAAGVGYAFGYSIKQGFTYSATTNAYRVGVTGTAGAVTFEMGGLVNMLDANQVDILPNACGPVILANLTPIQTNRIGSQISINNTSAANYTVFQNWVANNNRNYFTVLAFGPQTSANTGAEANVHINSITITEVHPFSLTPTTASLTCGTTTPQVFTVTNSTNAPGVTNYTWNLGPNNGWLYNGNPAPPSFSTGTVNSITLTPDCGRALSNVTATVTVGGTGYTTNTSTISVAPPSYTISGSSSICSGTTSYNINGLVCNSSVVWTAPPSTIASLSSLTTSPTTLTYNGTPGDFVLTANVTSCGVTQQVTLPVKAGSYTSSDYTMTAGNGGEPLYWCPNQTYGFTINGPASNYSWTIPTGWTSNYNGGYFHAIKAPASSYPPTGQVSVTFTEPCGTSITKSFFVAYSSSACIGTDPRFTYSPNPTTSYINVAVASGYTGTVYINRIQIVNNSTYATVFDQTYGLYVSSTYITTSSFPSGTYSLRIYDGSTWAVYQLVK